MDNLSPYFWPGLLFAIMTMGYGPIVGWRVAFAVLNPPIEESRIASRWRHVGQTPAAFVIGTLELGLFLLAGISLHDLNDALVQTTDLYSLSVKLFSQILSMSILGLAVGLTGGTIHAGRLKSRQKADPMQGTNLGSLLIAGFALVVIALLRRRRGEH